MNAELNKALETAKAVLTSQTSTKRLGDALSKQTKELERALETVVIWSSVMLTHDHLLGYDLSPLVHAIQQPCMDLAALEDAISKAHREKGDIPSDLAERYVPRFKNWIQSLGKAWTHLFPNTPLTNGLSVDEYVRTVDERISAALAQLPKEVEAATERKLDEVAQKAATAQATSESVKQGLDNIQSSVTKSVAKAEKDVQGRLDKSEEARLELVQQMDTYRKQTGDFLKDQLGKITEDLPEELDRLLKDREEYLEGKAGEAEALVEQVRSAKQQLDKLAEAFREVGQEVGIASYARNFSNLGDRYRLNAQGWFAGAVGTALFLGLMLASFIALALLMRVRDIETLVQLITIKVTAAALVSTGLFVCIRNHRRCMHNAVVNEHRANALSSFEAFTIAAGQDPEVKRELLLQATQTIYSHRATGYDDQSEDVIPMMNQTLDIVKSVAQRQ
ncbi:MAG: hypothetical protein H6839_13810 [Planctomycetes bacterium]|nr:hypothetical protein [Planctomycetota bacterium]